MTPNAMASGARRRKRSVSELGEGIRLPYGRVGDHAESRSGGRGRRHSSRWSLVVLALAVAHRLGSVRKHKAPVGPEAEQRAGGSADDLRREVVGEAALERRPDG